MQRTIVLSILLVLTIATIVDLRTRRIPNWLVLPFLVIGVGVMTWMKGSAGLVSSLSGIGVAILLYGVAFIAGGMGAGDVKLFAAIAAWIGPLQTFNAFVVAGVAGGVMALVWAVIDGFLLELVANTGAIICFWRPRETRLGRTWKDDPSKRRMMPYSPAIAIGTLASFLMSRH